MLTIFFFKSVRYKKDGLICKRIMFSKLRSHSTPSLFSSYLVHKIKCVKLSSLSAFYPFLSGTLSEYPDKIPDKNAGNNFSLGPLE